MAPPAGRRAILVLGMHRSFTSAATRALGLLGATLPATPMPPGPDNPDGFWESVPLVALNDAILAAGGSSWRDWTPFPPPRIASGARADFGRAVQGTLAAEFGDAPLLAIKDPRLCRLLPVWRPALAALGIAPMVLLAMRHPAAVAASLARRDGMPGAEAALLWLRHVLDAERETRDLPRAFLFANELLADWRGAMERAGAAMGLSWPRPPASVEADFLRQRRPDAEGPLESGSAYGDVWCAHAWRGLQALAAGDGTGAEALDRVAGQFEDACRLFAPAVARPARPALPEVTLCAVDGARVELTLAALARSSAACRFGDAVLLTNRSPPLAAPVRVERAGPLASRADYSRFVLQRLAAHVRTRHVLLVQWDGFVVSPAAWENEFLDYDYVGARWTDRPPGRDVGNGGFSLRSRRLLQALLAPEFADAIAAAGDTPEDVLICRDLRAALERDHGIRFAPAAVAERFSHERSLPRVATFGFHGLFNFWRYLGDADMAAVARMLPEDVRRGREFAELVALCILARRPQAAGVLGACWRDVATAGEIRAALSAILPPELLADGLAVVGARSHSPP